MEYLLGLLVLSPFTAVIIGFVALYFIVKKRLNVSWNYWTIGLMSLFVWSIVVAFINKSFWSAGSSLLILVFFLAAQFSSHICKDKNILHKTLNILISLTTVAAVVGILEKIVFIALGYGAHRIFSTFGNPNMTGGWFATIFFVAVYMFLNTEEKNRKTGYLIKIALMLFALFLTGSRSSYISVGVVSVVMVFLRGIRANKKLVLGIIIASIGIIVLATVAETKMFSEYVIAHPFEDSLNPRMKIWKDAFNMIKEKPFTGWGLLATLELGAEVLVNYNMPTIHVHNLWLMFLSTLGVVGLAIYCYMKVNLYKDIFILSKKNKDLALLCLAINLVAVIQGIVDVSLFAPQIGIVFSITGGVAVKLRNRNSRRVKEIYIHRRKLSNAKEIAS